MKLMTYKEYVKWRMDRMTWWKKSMMYLSSNSIDWRKPYYEYALLSLVRAKSLEEVQEAVNVALPGGRS